jgi:hypothetical protein
MISIRKLSPLLVAGCAAIVAMSGNSRAQIEPPRNPQALHLLQQACDYLKQQSSYGFRADIAFDEVLVPDFKVQYHATTQVILRRPSELRVDYKGDRRNVNFYYTILRTELSRYDAIGTEAFKVGMGFNQGRVQV